MAIVGLSEFMFGFGFLYEQTQQNWTNLRIAPILPSLTQEAEEAWDARLPLIGTDFYYQFKLSDYLERRNSRFHRDGTYDAPYYRVAFHRRNNNRQHNRLCEHAKANPQTYYVAPEFDSIDDFNDAFLARQLGARSRLIPLTECDPCDDSEQHYLTFQGGDPSWLQHSKKKRRAKSYGGHELESLYRSTANKWRKIDVSFAEATLARNVHAVKTALRREPELEFGELDKALRLLDSSVAARGREDFLIRTAQILSAFVGTTMVLIGEPAQ